jgi:hypothetical protein
MELGKHGKKVFILGILNSMNHKFAVTKKRMLSMFLEGKNPVSILNELYPGINFTVVSSQVRLRNFFFL